ncbi:hypothetical protein N431DRAFT_460888 [Stipitochalara longipes BDJ]|nr:hypothetical protein N431DRAFT_460888 [Stipitochalara longipes BDJ]
MEISTDRAQWEKHLSYYLEKTSGETVFSGGDYDFIIACNTKRFAVAISPSSNPDDKIRLLLSQYSEADQADDDEQIQNVEGEILDMIYEAGWRMFARLAPSLENRGPGSPENLYSSYIQKRIIFV